jgi:4-diphosphocytidyl-2-C-methyl-D-erythritol kinase
VLRALAPAKVNLVLEVLGRRPDGYHEIDTVLQTLALADDVTLTFGEGDGIAVSGPFADGTPADERNLAWRAAAELARRLGRKESLSIALEKRIPPAGGLGGGASDAATVLRLLQRRWPEANDATLFDVANTIGSDEAFFLLGGTVRARGRGEQVERLAALPRRGVVLFVPGTSIELKTARMFAAIGQSPFDDGHVSAAFARETPAQFGAEDVYNAFERVAYNVFPGLAHLSEDLESRTGRPVRLAGAGPTLYWIGAMTEAGAVAASAAGAACRIISTETIDSVWQK